MPEVSVEPLIKHKWDVSIQEAKKLQIKLADKVKFCSFPATNVRTVIAVDVSYSRFDRIGYAVLGIFEVEQKNSERRFEIKRYDILEHIDKVNFPYVPGYLSFREIPILFPLFKQISTEPDVILVDGAGIAHPRRIGLASHIGVIFNVTTIGCAKSHLIGEYTEPKKTKGSYSPLFLGGKEVGAVVRTKDNTRPLFVSPGNRIDIQSSVEITLRFCDRYRLPEPIRLIDARTKSLRKKFQSGGK